MDLTTLGLAKKYANEKVKEAVFDGAKVVLDSTLTEAGSAAEARAVGDKIKEIEAKFPSFDKADPGQFIAVKAVDGNGRPTEWEVTDIPDAVPTPATAKAGQAIMVESVDENGKPTSWKPVDVVIKNLDDITTIKETNLQCGFYYRLSDPLPDGWYYYDDTKHSGKIPTLVVINKDNTAVAGTMALNAAVLMYITSSETYITVTIYAKNGGVSRYGYNLETNEADYYSEKTYSAPRTDYFLNQKISSPEAAEVNQLLSVKTVDENGKPIEWEAIDLSERVLDIIKSNYPAAEEVAF